MVRELLFELRGVLVVLLERRVQRGAIVGSQRGGAVDVGSACGRRKVESGCHGVWLIRKEKEQKSCLFLRAREN
jgi:hypothetical protein